MRWILALVAVGLLGAAGWADDKARTITFSKDNLDKVPTGWKAGHTGKAGTGTWKVVADATAPSKTGYVLS